METWKTFYADECQLVAQYLAEHPAVATILGGKVYSDESEDKFFRQILEQDASPEEIYVDVKMVERGMSPDLYENKQYLARVRKWHISQLTEEDYIVIKHKYQKVPAVYENQEVEEEPVLAIAPQISAQCGVVAGIVEAIEAGEVFAGPIVFADRVEHDERVMGWLGDVAASGAAARLKSVERLACSCRGEGLWTPLVTGLTVHQANEIGPAIGTFRSVRWRQTCLCCARQRFFQSLFNDYKRMDPKVRKILWAMEEREAVRKTRWELDPGVVLEYASSNPRKIASMRKYLQEVVPESELHVVETKGREIQGNFSDIVRDKLQNFRRYPLIVDDAGYMDDVGYPGPYAKWIYEKRPVVRGDQVAVVVMGLREEDDDGRQATRLSVGVQRFEGGPSAKSDDEERAIMGRADIAREEYGDWRDIMYPNGLLSGPLIEHGDLVRKWNCARHRALRGLFRQQGWLF